jgi:hypothetical protein
LRNSSNPHICDINFELAKHSLLTNFSAEMEESSSSAATIAKPRLTEQQSPLGFASCMQIGEETLDFGAVGRQVFQHEEDLVVDINYALYGMMDDCPSFFRGVTFSIKKGRLRNSAEPNVELQMGVTDIINIPAMYGSMGRAMVGKFIHYKDDVEDRLQLDIALHWVDAEQIATQPQGKQLRNQTHIFEL